MSRIVALDGSRLAGLTAAWALSRAGARVRVVSAGPVGGGHAERAPFRFEHGGRDFTFPAERGAVRIWRRDRNVRRLLDTLGTTRALRVTRKTARISYATQRRLEPSGPHPLPPPLRWLTANRGIPLARATAFDAALDTERLRGRHADALVEGLKPESGLLAYAWHQSSTGWRPRLCGLAESLTRIQSGGLIRPGDCEYAVLAHTRQRVLVDPLLAAIEAAGGEVIAAPVIPLEPRRHRAGWIALRMWFRGAPLDERADAGEIPGACPVFTWLHRVSPDFSAWRDATGGSVLEMTSTSTGEGLLERSLGLAEELWPEIAGSYVAGQVILPDEASETPAGVQPLMSQRCAPSRLEPQIVAGVEAAHRLAAEAGVDASRLPPVLAPPPPSTVFLRARAALRRAGVHKGW